MNQPSARNMDQAVDEVLGEPGPADLEQQQADPMDHPAVRVAQDGPVMVKVLPTDGPWDSGRVTLDAVTTFARAVKPDKRRAYVQLLSTVAFRYGSTQEGAVRGPTQPAGEPLRLTTTGEVWVARDALDAVVGFHFESWTA